MSHRDVALTARVAIEYVQESCHVRRTPKRAGNNTCRALTAVFLQGTPQEPSRHCRNMSASAAGNVCRRDVTQNGRRLQNGDISHCCDVCVLTLKMALQLLAVATESRRHYTAE